MLALLATLAAASCRQRVPNLHPMYAEDHLNYLCMNYTRPTPLPCRKVADDWKPRWGGGGTGKPSRFIIYAWWPPLPADFEAYANAGFNLALTGNAIGEYCYRKGANSTVTHDELFEVNVATSDALAKLGVLTVFDTDNMCNAQLYRAATVAYGNATGGIVEGKTNITARAPGLPADSQPRPISKGHTIPELSYITSELARRNKIDQFGGIQMHDDTLTQTGETISSVAWLREHANSFVPFVNQVGGASGPQTLQRTGLFISAPEQYPMHCPNGNCSDPSVNATAFAMRQMNANANNAWVDARFGLQSWPLFQVGAGNGPLDGRTNPDNATANVRSDSLVRWMVYSAVAYGATALNYYCWGGGVWWYNQDPTKPGKPTPTFQTVVEANADASAWGDELLAGGFRFVGALHTGFTNERDGGGGPSDDAVVVSMSDDLLVGVFVPPDAEENTAVADAPSAYLFVVDKRVSGELGVVPARNVTLALHPAVAEASVALPGVQGARGFDELRERHGGVAPAPGTRRQQYSHTQREAPAGVAAASDVRRPRVLVTVELVGGGGGLVRLHSAPGSGAALIDACFSFIEWTYPPGEAHLSARSPSLNFGLKAPSWAYDSWHARYRPYEGLELTAGRSFEDGEQTNFIVGASFRGAPAPTAADEAEAWAWAGFNLLSVEAPPQDDLAKFGTASAAVGTVLDNGYPFGYFAIVEPATNASSGEDGLLSPSDVLALNRAFRCHGRWAGLMLAHLADDALVRNSTVAAAAALRTFAQGSWLLPFATASNVSATLELGKRGVPLAMPAVPAVGAASAVAWAQAVVEQYEPMRAMLAASYVPYPGNAPRWRSVSDMPFVAALDACVSESDSLLRWSAFSALAYGARGIFWHGAGRCAPLGSPRAGLLASINKRIVQWGNTFVASWAPGDFPGGGYNVTNMWSTGFAVPHAVLPGSGGAHDLVQAADPDVLVVEMGSQGRQGTTSGTPLIYIVDQRVSPQPGGAPARTVRIRLRDDVLQTQPLEGDCAATRCQCGMSLLGNTVTLRLPGGSGQLVALYMA